MKRGRTIGASDLMAELQSDPEWVERDRQREQRRQADEAYFGREESPLVADLVRAGYDVKSVYDLVNSTASYASALPVLIGHLGRAYPPRIREGIARALAVQEALGLAGKPVLDALRDEQSPDVRWALANSLTIVADKSDAQTIKSLIDDPSFEDVRERLQQAFRNLS